MRKIYCYIFFFIAICNHITAQTDTSYKLEEVVITATRSERKLGNVAVPVSIISNKLIKQIGSLKLQDILQEQTGLVLVNSSLSSSLAGYPNPFGQGIQMQGLDPAYTSILLDGEPLIGRNGGVLKLGRLAIGTIKQIEIVKGPSSSLYGSEAMAGVINIITENPTSEKLDIQLHHATNNTFAQTIAYNNKFKKTALTFFANHYTSKGYDLDNKIYGQTVEPYREINGMLKLTHQFSKKSTLLTTVRLYDNQQNNNYLITPPNEKTAIAKGVTNEKDISAFAQYKLQISPKRKIYFRTFYDRYANTAFVNNENTGAKYDETSSKSTILKPEFQFESDKNNNSKYVAGFGAYLEMIDATRYDGSKKLTTLYAFTQKEWSLINDKLKIIGGARFDKRNDFNLNFSPRLAMAYTPNKKVKIAASFGTGFKAPDFRHIYLAFYNQQIGYSLIGNNILGQQLQILQQNGEINSSVNISDYANAKNLLPEKLTGFNVSLNYTEKKYTLGVDVFRNDVKNLIDFYLLPFTKSNSSSIYSYHNISKVYTQGFTIDAKYNINKNFYLQGGYQYLDAKDKAVLDSIAIGKLYQRDPNTFQVSVTKKSAYFGLNNRSKHTCNFKINFTDNTQTWNVYARCIYRGKFGFTDINGNGVADNDKEMVQGYWLANFAAAKTINKNLQLQVGVENIFNYTNPVQLPNIAGRLFFLNINYTINQLLKNK